MSNLRTTLWLRCLLGRSLAAFTLAFIRTRTGYDLRTCCKLLAPWQLVGQERSTKADEYAEEIHGGLKSDEGLLAWELQYRRKIGGIGVPACTPSKPQATRIPNCFQIDGSCLTCHWQLANSQPTRLRLPHHVGLSSGGWTLPGGSRALGGEKIQSCSVDIHYEGLCTSKHWKIGWTIH